MSRKTEDRGGDATRLELTRHIPASPEDVFAAWTDAESLRHWMCPGGVEEARAELDVREGGSYRIDMVEGDEVHRHRGEYLEVDPPRRLVFTWISPATGEEESRVTVQLEGRKDGTRLRLVHERLPDADTADRHRAGWTQILEKLSARFGVRAPGG